MKEVLVALVILAYVIPFTYMVIADIVDVYRRISEVVSGKLKPAMVVMVRSFIN
jgi:hypothetical protein